MERFQTLRVVGLILGLCGVALIALPAASLPDRLAMVAFLPLALIGPLFYAMEATFVARYGTVGMDAVQAMFGVSCRGAGPLPADHAGPWAGLCALAGRAGGGGADRILGAARASLRNLCLARRAGGGGLCRRNAAIW